MDKNSFPKNKPSVLIISEISGLSYELISALKFLGLSIYVASEDTVFWKKRFSENKDIHFLRIMESEKIIPYNPDYIIVLSPSTFDKNFFKKIRKVEKLIYKLSLPILSKILFVFPFLQDRKLKDKISIFSNSLINDKNLFCAVIYLSDVLYSFPEDETYWFLNRILKEIRSLKKIDFLPTSFVFNPLTAKAATKLLLRILFSLKGYGKKTAIVGRNITSRDLIRMLKMAEKQIYFKYERNIPLPVKPEFDLIIRSQENFKEEILAAYSRINPTKVSKWGKLKVFKIGFFSIFLFLGSPILFMLLSFSLLFLFQKVNLRDTKVASIKLETARVSAHISNIFSEPLIKIPFLGEIYEEVFLTTSILEKASRVFSDINSLRGTLFEIWGKFSEEGVDTIGEINKLKLGLEDLYRKLGFLEADVRSSRTNLEKISSQEILDLDIFALRDKIVPFSNFLGYLPEVLGKDSTKTYLFLFQDSRILRPTGGLIRGFSLVTFSGGKISNIESYDSAFVNKNLKISMAPPQPLEMYFNQKKWFLRDSNWDLDFSISATQAEWFVDKGLGISVDGVVSINGEFVKSALERLGEISVNGRVINGKNFYSLTQLADVSYYLSEEPDFFSKVSSEVLNRILNLKDPKKQRSIVDIFLIALEQRDVQLFLNQRNAQRSLSELGWDGALKNLDCKPRCYKDILALAQVSDQVSDLGLIRNSQLEISFEEKLIKRSLTLFFENPNSQTYRNYIRIVAAPDSGFSPFKIYSEGEQQWVYPEIRGLRGFKEAGVFLEILPNTTKKIIFSWEGPLNENLIDLEYAFLLRKQAGVKPYPVEISVKVPQKIKIFSEVPKILTDRGGFHYNTMQSQDIDLRLYFSDSEDE